MTLVFQSRVNCVSAPFITTKSGRTRKIAAGTTKTEMGRIITAVRVDVLDVHRLSGVVLARLTVLAAALSAFIDEPFGCPPG